MPHSMDRVCVCVWGSWTVKHVQTGPVYPTYVLNVYLAYHIIYPITIPHSTCLLAAQKEIHFHDFCIGTPCGIRPDVPYNFIIALDMYVRIRCL
jgi:hypothetical protein